MLIESQSHLKAFYNYNKLSKRRISACEENHTNLKIWIITTFLEVIEYKLSDSEYQTDGEWWIG